MNEEMVTIQAEVPRSGLDMAAGLLQALLDAVTEAQNQISTQEQGVGARGTAVPGNAQMTPEQQALQGEIEGMSQLR